MTLSTTSSSVTYQGNGSTTVFPYGFPVLDPTTFVITITNTLVSPNTVTTLASNQYSYTGIGSSGGGNITLLTDPATGAILATGKYLTISRVVQLTQSTSIVNQSGFYPAVLESALDNIAMQVQQVSNAQSQMIQAPIGTTNTAYLAAAQTAANSATSSATDAAGSASSASASATSASTSATSASGSASAAGSYASTCLAALASAQTGAITTTQIAGLNMSSMVGLTSTQVGLIQSTQMGALSSTQLNGLSAAGMTGVSVASAAAFFKNLKIQVTSNTAATVSADLVQMANASGATISKAVSSTIGTGATGLNGLDTGTVAAATWYYVWAVSNGTTTGVVLSTSSTAPNSAITATYPYYARIGALRTAATAVLMATVQYGRRVQYVVGGVNVANLPIMSSGAQGSPTTPTWVAVSVSTFVPATAFVIVGVVATGNGYTFMAAPNNSYGTANSTTNPPPVAHVPYSGETGLTETFSFVLESTNIYWAVAGAGSLACLGWEDNL